MNTTTPLHGHTTRDLPVHGIRKGEPVRIFESASGTFRIKAAGKRQAAHLTWDQVMDRVEPA